MAHALNILCHWLPTNDRIIWRIPVLVKWFVHFSLSLFFGVDFSLSLCFLCSVSVHFSVPVVSLPLCYIAYLKVNFSSVAVAFSTLLHGLPDQFRLCKEICNFFGIRLHTSRHVEHVRTVCVPCMRVIETNIFTFFLNKKNDDFWPMWFIWSWNLWKEDYTFIWTRKKKPNLKQIPYTER